MDKAVLTEKIRDYMAYLDVERNSSKNTLRAYESDLSQLVEFWETVDKREPFVPHDFDHVVRRYIVALFYKKISKTSLARKFSCLRSFQQFLQEQGIIVNLAIKSPRLDRKLPITLTVDEIFFLLDTVTNDELPTKFPNQVS